MRYSTQTSAENAARQRLPVMETFVHIPATYMT
jgi:hypothetical protein